MWVKKPIYRCTRCEKSFTTHYNLNRHMLKKIPCDKFIKCEKCDKSFKTTSNFKRHMNRKTSCKPIQGMMIGDIKENRCRFCGKEYKNKYILNNHYSVCKIKNGGMDVLFDTLLEQKQTIEKQTIEIHKLKQQTLYMQNGNQNIIGDNNTIKNHFNTIINIPLVCFMGDDHRNKMLAIVEANLGILYKPIKTDISHQEQLQNRIGDFIQVIYRNPAYKELQNVYTKHNFDQTIKDNAFVFREDPDDGTGEKKWHIGNWANIGKDMLNKIYGALSHHNVKKKEDILKIMTTVMIAAGLGTAEDPAIADENLHELYCEIGRRMGFGTLILEN